MCWRLEPADSQLPSQGSSLLQYEVHAVVRVLSDPLLPLLSFSAVCTSQHAAGTQAYVDRQRVPVACLLHMLAEYSTGPMSPLPFCRARAGSL